MRKKPKAAREPQQIPHPRFATSYKIDLTITSYARALAPTSCSCESVFRMRSRRIISTRLCFLTSASPISAPCTLGHAARSGAPPNVCKRSAHACLCVCDARPVCAPMCYSTALTARLPLCCRARGCALRGNSLAPARGGRCVRGPLHRRAGVHMGRTFGTPTA